MRNNPSRYIKYVIGEIVLVVIGILLALQINNWNEFRKQRLIEKNLLNEIGLKLIKGIADLTLDINQMLSNNCRVLSNDKCIY